MAVLDALFAEVLTILPVFLRISAFLVAIPIFGRGVPPLAKVGLGALLALLVWPNVPVNASWNTPLEWTLMAMAETAVGVAMGLIVTTVVMALYLAGQFIDVPMGFGMVNVADPQTGAQIPIIAQLQYIVAMLILFVVDGHHALLWSLTASFHALPIGEASMGAGVVGVAAQAFGAMFTLGLSIALPVMGTLFLTDVTLGIIARAVPQVNVFFIGFPIKIAVGFLILVAAMPVFVGLIAQALGASGEVSQHLHRLIQALGQGGQ